MVSSSGHSPSSDSNSFERLNVNHYAQTGMTVPGWRDDSVSLVFVIFRHRFGVSFA